MVTIQWWLRRIIDTIVVVIVLVMLGDFDELEEPVVMVWVLVVVMPL